MSLHVSEQLLFVQGNPLQLDLEICAPMPCCQQVIKEVTDLTFFNEAISTTQGSNIWHQERQLRITGE